MNCLTGMKHLLCVDHHQWFTFATPEDARIVEAGNVHVRAKLAFTLFCRRWRHTESDWWRYTSHATSWAYVLQIILCTWFFSHPGLAPIPDVTDIGLAKNILLVISVRYDPANDKVLIFRPIRKRYDSRVPEDSCVLGGGVGSYL